MCRKNLLWAEHGAIHSGRGSSEFKACLSSKQVPGQTGLQSETLPQVRQTGLQSETLSPPQKKKAKLSVLMTLTLPPWDKFLELSLFSPGAL